MSELFGADGMLPAGYGGGAAYEGGGHDPRHHLAGMFDKADVSMPNVPRPGHPITGRSVSPGGPGHDMTGGGPQSPTGYYGPGMGAPPAQGPPSAGNYAQPGMGAPYGAAAGVPASCPAPPYTAQSARGSGGYIYRIWNDPARTIQIVQAPAGKGAGLCITPQSNPTAYAAIMAEVTGRRVDPAAVAAAITAAAQTATAALQAAHAPRKFKGGQPPQLPAVQPQAPLAPGVPTWVWWVGGALAVAGIGSAIWWATRPRSSSRTASRAEEATP